MDLHSHPGSSTQIAPRPEIADRLATLLRIPTVSAERREHTDAFIRFPQELARL